MYTLNELVALVNTKLKNDGVDNLVNDRLIRHYTTVKLVPPAIKEGREARYTDEHVSACVALRQAQNKGLTTKSIKTFQNDNYVVERNQVSTSISSDITTKEVETSINSIMEPSTQALSFLRSLDSTALPTKSFSAQNVSTSRGMLDTLAVASAVGSSVYSSPTFIEQQWTTISIRDGLQINVRNDIRATLTKDDFHKMEMAITQFKK